MLLPAAGLVEGLGVLLLAPLLAVAGLVDADKVPPVLTQFFQRIFAFFGLPLNLISVLVFFVVLMLLRECFLYFSAVLQARLRERFLIGLRSRLYGSLLRSDWLFFTGNRGSDYLQVFTRDMDRIGHCLFFMFQVFSRVVFLGAYGLAALITAPWVTLSLGLVAAVLLWVNHRRTRSSTESGREISRQNDLFFAAVSEHLAGMKVAKSFVAESRHLQLFEAVNRRLMATWLHFISHDAGIKFRFSLQNVIAFCLFLYLMVAVFHLEPAAILLLLVIFARMTPYLSSILQSVNQAKNALPAYAAYLDKRNACEAVAEPEPPDPIRPLGLEKSVRLEGVGLVYPGRDQAALIDIHLDIPARKTTALVGASGAGKSSLADIVMGLVQPTSGALTVDGRTLTGPTLYRWRAGVGYVPQETFLFSGTIRENLSWARPDAQENEMIATLEMAAAGFVLELPKGLDTEVGERGVRLSGGERQRIALARALLVQPALLILDEATSALDMENERKIRRAVENLAGNCTLLVIAHRLSTIRDADQIIVLDQGRIVQQGHWQKLSQEPGPFLNLLQGQIFEAN